MFLFFQGIHHTQEHLKNNLLNATSLRVRRMGRNVADERSILPETVGPDAQGGGEPWSVERLLTEGDQAAREAGIEQPSEADCVRYGLFVAARLNPLSIPADRISKLLRQSLYADILDEPLPPQVIDSVIDRMLDAIQQHLTEPAAGFNAWFSGGNNSFVRQIVKRKRLPGGRLDPKIVRQVRLNLGWQGYQYVADCVHTVMREIEMSMPETLTEAERNTFERTYLNQATFGNLSLVLLYVRFPFLKAVLSDFLDRPNNEQAIGILQRLLDWYGDMAMKRREVDRTVKQRRPTHLPEGEKPPLTVPLTEFAAVTEADESEEPRDVDFEEPGTQDTEPTMDLFSDIVEQVCRERQLHCSCGRSAWHHRPVAQDGVTVTVEHICGTCQFVTRSTIPVERFRQVLRDGAG